ncbi:MAG: class I SAM-dependent methyltransferase [Candidatus Acidiferrales bacterium]
MKFVRQQPGYALQALAREVTWADERFIGSLTRCAAANVRRFLDEPSQDAAFAEHLRGCQGDFRLAGVTSADLYAKKVLLQYAVVRAARPAMIVETGVANGVSSAHILLALEKNGRGTLHSLEIGEQAYLPAGRETGWVVPAWLRGRWNLHIGDARAELPGLLRELAPVDIFIHDSLHTYEHMQFELRTAYPYVKESGLMVADDALWNGAFVDFARETDEEGQIIRGVGYLRKSHGTASP